MVEKGRSKNYISLVPHFHCRSLKHVLASHARAEHTLLAYPTVPKNQCPLQQQTFQQPEFQYYIIQALFSRPTSHMHQKTACFFQQQELKKQLLEICTCKRVTRSKHQKIRYTINWAAHGLPVVEIPCLAPLVSHVPYQSPWVLGKTPGSLPKCLDCILSCYANFDLSLYVYVIIFNKVLWMFMGTLLTWNKTNIKFSITYHHLSMQEARTLPGIRDPKPPSISWASGRAFHAPVSLRITSVAIELLSKRKGCQAVNQPKLMTW